MKIRGRQRIHPVQMCPGDTIALVDQGHELLKEEIGYEMTIDEVIIFDLDAGDIEGVKRGIGGAFLESNELQSE